MGKIEEESRKRTRKNELRDIIIKSVASAGLLSVAVLAPNALQALSMLGYKPKKNHKWMIGRSRKKLVEQGYLKYEGKFLRLTEKGEMLMGRLKLSGYKIRPPKKWDKKWRIVIFDIKENKRGLRDKMRRVFISAGFICLQRSVWAYPYDCEDFITLLKSEFKTGKDILYIVADAIENDQWLKEYFGLEPVSIKMA